MNQKQPCFVFDTNVLLDYDKIIPGEDEEEEILRESTINLDDAHLIIPTAVIRELAKFKKEPSDRGYTARVLLKRLRSLFENSSTGVLYDSYKLNQPQTIRVTKDENGVKHNQLISILPLHKSFCDNLPFKPSNDDMDGQIILTTIAVACLEQALEINGSASLDQLDFSNSNVTLLTNDNELAIRANARGIRTSRYGYKLAPLYTGRRDLEVPADLLEKFFNGASYAEREISLAEWQEAMPDQANLVANEFIVMHNDEAAVDHKVHPWNHIGRYDAKNQKIVPLQYLDTIAPSTRIQNDGQAMYIEAMYNPEIAVVICVGPPGSGKTYLATSYAYYARKDGKYIGIAVIPHQPDNKNGYLPGDLKEKMAPLVRPIINALTNLLLDTKYKEEAANLQKFGPDPNSTKTPLGERVQEEANRIFDNWFGTPIPVDSAKGLSFELNLVLLDEFQDHTVRNADMLINRLGVGGKMIVTGDPGQVHTAYLDEDNNGIIYALDELAGDPEVAVVSLAPNDVVRHPLIQRLAEKKQRKRKGRKFQGDIEDPKPADSTATAPQDESAVVDDIIAKYKRDNGTQLMNDTIQMAMNACTMGSNIFPQ